MSADAHIAGSAPRLFVPEPIGRERVGSSLRLGDAAAHHAARVLRLDIGDHITLFDGQGGQYTATLQNVHKRDVEVTIEAFEPIERESPLTITLVQSVIASDAMDYAVRKATELGVASITPVVAQRSQGAVSGERSDKRLAHWRGIAIAACEQCGRNRIPSVDAPTMLADWLRRYDVEQGIAAIAAPGAQLSLGALAARSAPRFLLIGPEGGFTEAEIGAALSTGVLAVHLGPRMLRAETAGTAALAMLEALAGDAR